MAKQKVRHVFVDSSGRETDLSPGEDGDEVEYSVTETAVTVDEVGVATFRHTIAR